MFAVRLRTRAIWLMFLVSCTASDRPKQPNIVMIVADDMGYQDVGFRGSDIMTRNIDKLANEGVILENHYTMPLCSPTRASLMSGRHAIRTGFWNNNIMPTAEWGLRLNETILPEMLKRNGYATHAIGKWHCGMYTWDHTPAKRGFDTFFGLYLGSQDYYTHKRSEYLDFRTDYHDEESKFVEKMRRDLHGQYSTELFTDRALDVIQAHDKARPLFLYLAYTAPHWPYDNPPPAAMQKFTNHINDKLRKPYAAMISVMDEGVGKVVEGLKQRNMMENTIVVFTSDNGANLRYRRSIEYFGSNYPLRGGKYTLFEGGVRAVSFVHSPLLQQTGYTNTNLHHVTDWYATFQKMVGDQPENHSKPQLPIDGVDIWRSISNNEPCRDEVLMNYRLQSMVDDTSDYEYRIKRDEGSFEQILGLEYTGGELENYSTIHKDVFVIRWNKWKLFNGTFLVKGWSDFNNQEPDHKFVNNKNKLRMEALGSGTLLFDLSKDPREETNVANERPDVVKIIMAKLPGYKEKITRINRINRSSAGMRNGKWMPWLDHER